MIFIVRILLAFNLLQSAVLLLCGVCGLAFNSIRQECFRFMYSAIAHRRLFACTSNRLHLLITHTATLCYY